MWMAVGHYNPVWPRVMPFELADGFLLNYLPLHLFEYLNLRYKHWKHGNGGIQNTDIGDDLQYEYTSCFQTHTPKEYGNWGWWLIPLQQQTFVLSLSPFFPFCTLCEQASGQWHWTFSEQDSRQSDLALITVLSCFLGTLSRRDERPGWEMGGQRVRFSIMTHRCRITLEIKSKMLNFNQAMVMACVRNGHFVSPLTGRERGNWHEKPRWDKVIQHFNPPNCMLASNGKIHLTV